MQEASATRRNTAARPGRGVPPGCFWAGRLLCRRSSPCSRHGIVAPSRIHPGPGGNAQRALPGPDPAMLGAATTTGWLPFLGAATTQMAPNPLRPKGCRGTAPPAVLPLLDDVQRHRRRRAALHPEPWRWQRGLREFFNSLPKEEVK